MKKKNIDGMGLVLYITYLLFLMAAVVVIGKLIYLIFVFEPDKKIEARLTPRTVKEVLEPSRGYILARDGRMLAMSYPVYDIFMDCTVRKAEFASKKNGAELEKNWLSKAKELSAGLAGLFPDKTASQYYSLISSKRKGGSGSAHVPIRKGIDWNTLAKLKQLPLFNEGGNKGGIIVEKRWIRRYPYGTLGRRTIGFVRDNRSNAGNRYVGIEGKCDSLLHGREGIQYLRKTDEGMIRNNDSLYVKPVDGKDIVTTLDVDYLEIADKALREQISNEDDIEAGCLILMETATGAIRAMVNLSRDPKAGGTFQEITNMSIGRRCEPGSVFKTVTLLSVVNDGCIKSLDETIPTNRGVVSGTRLKVDEHIVQHEREYKTKSISVLDGFKISSNYVFATLAIRHYGKDTQKYMDNIHSYHLDGTFDFDIDGMARATIPSVESAHRSMTTLGSMGFGYATELTPLHVVTFYNAIAGKGKMMKPYLIEGNGPSVLNSYICSAAAADTVTRALKAVTEEGTARRLKDAKCSVAGKTGTSFGTFEGGGYVDSQGRRKYQGTFVGFFPAEDPQYSIICTIYSKPTHKSFQGGGIPAKAVKQVIDGIYSIDPYWTNSNAK